MLRTVTFFDSREDLRELTGLPADNYDEALWEAGFDLDDWDFGFVSDEKWDDSWASDATFLEWWLLNKMESYCVGYKCTEYEGRYYYIAYHS